MLPESAAFVEKMAKVHPKFFAEAKNRVDLETLLIENKSFPSDLLVVTDTITGAKGWKNDVLQYVNLVDESGCFLITVEGGASRGGPEVLMKDLLAEIWKLASWKGAAVEEDLVTGDRRVFVWRKHSSPVAAKKKKSKTK